MDIRGVVKAITSESEEITIGRGVSTEVIFGEVKSVVITKQVGSTINVEEPGLVINIKSAV